MRNTVRLAMSVVVIGGLALVFDLPARVRAVGTVPAKPAATSGDSASVAVDTRAAETPSTHFDEQVLPADKADGAPMQPRENDSIYKLTNARIEHGPRPWPTLTVSYERIHTGTFNGQSLIVHRADGETQTYILIGPFRDKTGTIDIDLHFGGPFRAAPPKDAELYLARQDFRYGSKFHPTFKVSNSAVLGSMKELTFARQWTPAEAETLRLPPPDYSNPNAHLDVGEDTEFAGSKSGGVTSRFVSPGHPLIGVECRTGEWENEKCIAQLVPIFDRKQPVTVEPRYLAKAGYTVGAINVKYAKHVDAIQLVYVKLKSDGSLDGSDSYTSDWIGAEPADSSKSLKLAVDGRKVIGINCRHGAILDGLAVVVEDAPAH